MMLWRVAARGRSVVVAQEPSKLLGRVRFPSPASGDDIRGVAQSGSAPGWGPGGRRFKSCLPDYGKALHSGAFPRSWMRPLSTDGVQNGVQVFPPTPTAGHEAVSGVRPALREVGQLLRALAHARWPPAEPQDRTGSDQ